METSAKLNKKELPHQKDLQIDLGLLSKGEVANILRVSPCTIDRYVKKGWLTVKKLGTLPQSRCFFDRDEVLNFKANYIK